MSIPTITTLKRRKTNRLSTIPITEKVKLERVLGLTVSSSAALSADVENGIIAYPAGCTVVLHSSRKNRQCHIINTSKKYITCLTFSVDGRYLATGESGHQPKVRVWDVYNDNAQIAELADHKFGIVSVAFSPNSNYLVSVGNQHDMTVNVWNWRVNGKAASNKVSCKVKALSFGESGDYFVTVGVRHVKFWYMERNKGTKLQDTIPLQGRSAILADQRNNNFCDVACGRGTTSASTFCITQSGLLCEFNGRRILEKWVELRVRGARALVLGSDLLFIGCSDGIVRIFNAISLSFVATLPLPHQLGVDVAAPGLTPSAPAGLKFPDTVAVCYEPKYFRLTCIYADHSLYQWDVHDFSHVGKIASFLYHSGSVWSIESCSDTSADSPLPRDTFVTCSNDDTIRLWNIDANMLPNQFYRTNVFSQELLKVLYTDSEFQSLSDADSVSSDKSDCERRNGVRVIRISPDGQDLASGDRRGNLRMFQLKNSMPIREIEAHDSEILTLEYSHPDTGYSLLVSGSRDRMMHVLAADDNYEPLMSIEGHSAAVIAAKFGLIQTELFLISCGCDRMIVFHKLTFEPEPQFARTHCIAAQMVIYDMDLDAKSRHIYAACQDRQIRVFNTFDGKVRKCFKASAGDDGSLLKLTLDGSSHYAAVSCSDKTLAIFNIKTTDCEALMLGHGEVCTGMKFSADYRRLIAVSGDSCIYIWRLATELTEKLIALSKRPVRQYHHISVGDDMLSATDDDRSVVDEPVDGSDSSSAVRSRIVGSVTAPDPVPEPDVQPKPKPRSKWARAPLPSTSADDDDDDDECFRSAVANDLDSKRKMLSNYGRFLSTDSQSVSTPGLSLVTQRLKNSQDFGSLANMRLIGSEDEADSKPDTHQQPIIYDNLSSQPVSDRQFEVKERSLDSLKARSYGRTDTFGNDISDEEEISGNPSKDVSWNSNKPKTDDDSFANDPFNDISRESPNSGFERGGSARLSITSKYLLKNKNILNALQDARLASEAADKDSENLKTQQRSKWQSSQIGVKVIAATPPIQSFINNKSNEETPSAQSANSGGILWSYKAKTPTRTPTASLDTTPTTPKAIADPQSVIKAKELSNMAKGQGRRQSMPDYTLEGPISSPIESPVAAFATTHRDSRISLVSSCSTFATSKSLASDGKRNTMLNQLHHYQKLGGTGGSGGGGSLYGAEKLGAHGYFSKRLPNSLSLGSLAHATQEISSSEIVTETHQINQKLGNLKEKLRKSQENLSHTVESPQKAKSYCSLAQRRSDVGWSRDQSDLGSAVLEAHGLARSVSNIAAPAGSLSEGQTVSSSGNAAARYRKVPPAPVSGVQKKLFQLRAKYSTGSSNDGKLSLAPSADHQTVGDFSAENFSKISPKNVALADAAATPCLPNAKRSATPLASTTVTPLRGYIASAPYSKDDATGPRRTSYLARLLADEGAQQLNSDNEKSMEACVAPEMFDGAHFEKMSAHCRESVAEFRKTLDKILQAHRLVQADGDLTSAEKTTLLASLSDGLRDARRRLDHTLSDDDRGGVAGAIVSNDATPTLAPGADAFLQQCSDALVAIIQQKMAAANANQ